MILQISSGQGPAECELAVGKLLSTLLAEYPEIKVRSIVPGARKDCYKSVLIESERNLSHLEGSVQWICTSPFRPHHKRKNWYVDISVSGEAELNDIDDSLIRFETFRSSGKGLSRLPVSWGNLHSFIVEIIPIYTDA